MLGNMKHMVGLSVRMDAKNTIAKALLRTSAFGAAASLLVLPSMAISEPVNILPQASASAAAQSEPTAGVPGLRPSSSPAPANPSAAVEVSIPAGYATVNGTVQIWNVAAAQELLTVIQGIGAEGLFPADYKPTELSEAIANGAGDALNRAASRSFTWLAEDMRDGRTPMRSRIQWFMVDPDQDKNPTASLMERALSSGDVAGVITSLEPQHPDYAKLRAAFRRTPAAQTVRLNQIRINMDRWRWMPSELGNLYLITNVPEFQLRLTANDRIIRSYRTIVGKPGRSATPQLFEQISGVVFNPTWTVPQSIVVGEGLGQRLLNNPASARAQGYAVRRLENGMISVVQQPGDNNSLGRMKIDMPNPHAIYFHDTPNKNLFNNEVRAYSHGCIRTERAVELGMTMAILGAGITPAEAAELHTAGKYKKVNMTQTFPAYITYFTMATNIDGTLTSFRDLYGRDEAVLASFRNARQLKTTQRASDEAIIQLDNPL